MIFNDDELAAYPGTDGITEDTASLLRDLAEAYIYAVIPQEIADASVIAKGVALEMVARAYRNPGGFSSETVDDYTYRRDGATRSAGVYMTSDERAALLLLNTALPRTRTRSIRMRSWSAPQL